MNFSEWMWETRTTKGLRQKDLAEITGLSVNTIQRVESKHEGVYLETAVMIADSLGYNLVPVEKEQKND